MTFELGNRSLSGNEANELFRNDGDRYERIGFVAGARSTRDARGFVPADFDRDGDIDFFVTNNSQPTLYLENREGQKRHWIVVQPRGAGSAAKLADGSNGDNRFGIGARVTVVVGSKLQVREIHAGAGYLSSPPPEAHFGIGDATAIDRVEVRWPNGTVTRIENPDIDQVLVIQQPVTGGPAI